jgi:hypothetical protein
VRAPFWTSAYQAATALGSAMALCLAAALGCQPSTDGSLSVHTAAAHEAQAPTALPSGSSPAATALSGPAASAALGPAAHDDAAVGARSRPNRPVPRSTKSAATPGPRRIVAVGDLHGDFKATLAVLQTAGLVDEEAHWVGADAHLVQLGDVLDRGSAERAILDLFERLEPEAARAGGMVHVLLGNHELRNATRDYRYTTPLGFKDFADLDTGDPSLRIVARERRGRFAAFRPGGPYAVRLAHYPVVLSLGETVFVHGGVLPKHVAYGIERLNREASDFLLRRPSNAYIYLAAWDSPLNSRHYALWPNAADCLLLSDALTGLGAERMVVAHTPQTRGISSYCGGRVWAIDAGIASCCGNKREVLEIEGDSVRVLGRRSR